MRGARHPAGVRASVSTSSGSGRGRTSVEYELADLRRAAYKRIEAMERTAKHEIDRKALEIQTELVAAGLTTDLAVGFLSSMPSADDLMPEIDIETLGSGPGYRRELGWGGEDIDL
jgi:hypothetical protein